MPCAFFVLGAAIAFGILYGRKPSVVTRRDEEGNVRIDCKKFTIFYILILLLLGALATVSCACL